MMDEDAQSVPKVRLFDTLWASSSYFPRCQNPHWVCGSSAHHHLHPITIPGWISIHPLPPSIIMYLVINRIPICGLCFLYVGVTLPAVLASQKGNVADVIFSHICFKCSPISLTDRRRINKDSNTIMNYHEGFKWCFQVARTIQKMSALLSDSFLHSDHIYEAVMQRIK